MYILFDRDSTLIDRNNRLFNPDDMIPILQEIIANHRWGIVSTGAIEDPLRNDPAIIAMKQAGIPVDNNPPAYPQFGKKNESTIRAMKAFNGINDIEITSPPNIELEEADNDNLFKQALYNGEYDYNSKKLIYKREDGINLVATIADDAVLTISIGQSEVDLNVQQWFSYRERHANGDNKLLQSIEALDQLKVRFAITDALKHLGIQKIKTPEHYQEVQPNEVIMMDDKAGVYLLMATAGLHAIRADTEEVIYGDFEGDPNERNTYVRKLIAAFPTEMMFNILKNRVSHKQLSFDDPSHHAAIAEVFNDFIINFNSIEELTKLMDAIGIGWGEAPGIDRDFNKLRQRKKTRFHDSSFRETNDSHAIANKIIDRAKQILRHTGKNDFSEAEKVSCYSLFSREIKRERKVRGGQSKSAQQAHADRMAWLGDFFAKREAAEQLGKNRLQQQRDEPFIMGGIVMR